MTETPLRVRSLADAFALPPSMLGFTPADSLVVVTMRDREVVFAVRVDLGTSPFALVSHMLPTLQEHEINGVLILGYSEAFPVAAKLAAVLGTLLEGLGLGVDLVAVTDGTTGHRVDDAGDLLDGEPIADDVRASALTLDAHFRDVDTTRTRAEVLGED